ncbi:MAG: response regulator [bacterium]
MNEIIAIIDDEPDLLELVSRHLKKFNYNVREYQSAKHFFDDLENYLPDLILLDLMLPDVDGIEICRKLKKDDKFESIPIIMLTARGDESDKVLGLELGADDYVTKPFSLKELTARVKAVLRRRKSTGEEENYIKIGNSIIMDLQRYEVSVDGEKINLTPTEFRILKILAERQGWVFTREQLLDYLWGHDKAVLDRTIDVHIKHLREKLGDKGKYIQNIRGVGYKINL